jgi:osmoprotectant transport system substrate-binding protein
VVRSALQAGEVGLYPEYTGNGAFFFDMTDSPVWNSAENVVNRRLALAIV